MPDAAQIMGAKPSVQPVRGMQRDPNQRQGQGAGAEAGFAALLVAVEQIALNREAGMTGAAQMQAQAKANAEGAPAGDALPKDMIARPNGAQGLFVTLPNMGQATASQKQAGENAQGAKPLPLPSQAAPRATEAILERGPAGPEAPSLPKAHERVSLTPAQAAALDTIEQAHANRGGQQRLQGADTQVASTPRIDAAIQQQATPETSNPVVRQVAQNVQYVARGEMERIRFDLFPEELGRVQVQLQKHAGVTRLTIVTETPQAFEALQRGAGGLQQSLSQSGFEADDMHFEHREDQGGERRAAAEERREREGRRDWDEREERREVLVRPARANDRIIFL